MIVTRRNTLALAGSMALGALGCENSSRTSGSAYPRQPRGDDGHGPYGAFGGGSSVVPDVTAYSSRFNEVIGDIRRFLKETSDSYPPGYTVDNARDWPQGVQDLRDPVRRALANTEARQLRTPVVGSHRNLSRYFQLGGPDARHFSLIAGHGDRGYSVHNSWLGWLLEEDNCDLEVSGSTEFGSCAQILHHPGCRIQVTVQDFRMPSGQPKRLVWPDLRADSYSPNEIRSHQEHSERFLGCGSFKGRPTLTQAPCHSGS